MTLATDLLLALACGCFSLLLFRMKSAATGWWCIGFAAVAVAALVGGSNHAFPSFYPNALWKTTLVAAGAASGAMVIATGIATRVAPKFFFWFSVLKFADPGDPEAVYVENLAGELFVEEPHEVERFQVAFQRLVAVALSPDDTIAMIAEQAKS